MTDLAASQRNISPRIYIVAPESRRVEVVHQSARPTFNTASPEPMAERCKFIPYEKVYELAESKYLPAVDPELVDRILAEFLVTGVLAELRRP